jgi:hypothetical protein
MSEEWNESEGWDEIGGEEKFDEKWGEKSGGRSDPLGGLIGGLVLIMIGVGLFLWIQGWIASWTMGMGLFFLGLAAIFFLELLVRLVMPSYRRGIAGRSISVVVLALIGAGFLGVEFLGYDIWSFWPLILIAVGVVILLGAILGPLFRR